MQVVDFFEAPASSLEVQKELFLIYKAYISRSSDL